MNEDTQRTRKIWIDTDAGTDDAVALLMAFAASDIEIVGISTCGGNVPLECVTQNVLFLRDLCENSTDVHVGAAQPLSRTLGLADFIHGKDGLGDIGLPLHGRTPTSENATAALREAILKYQHELEIVTLGPLTNLATALLASPDLASVIGHLFIMGGLISGPGNVTDYSEYNIWADPEAAEVVLRTTVEITSIGWDTTVASGYLTIGELADLRSIGSRKAHIAHDICQVRLDWQRSQEEDPIVTWADPTTMAVVLDPTVILEKEKVKIHTRCLADDDPYRGYWDVETIPNSNVTHVSRIDRSRFVEMIRQAVSK
ncbi:MAG: nucleoside hydrolase [Bacteroidota bacterium]